MFWLHFDCFHNCTYHTRTLSSLTKRNKTTYESIFGELEIIAITLKVFRGQLFEMLRSGKEPFPKCNKSAKLPSIPSNHFSSISATQQKFRFRHARNVPSDVMHLDSYWMSLFLTRYFWWTKNSGKHLNNWIWRVKKTYPKISDCWPHSVGYWQR